MDHLPNPIRSHDTLGVAPSHLCDWRARTVDPPYDQFGPLLPLSWASELPLFIRQPTPGRILLLSSKAIDPNRQLRELSWLRAAVPWVSLAVQAPEAVPPATMGSLLTRVARRGAVVISESEAASPAGTAGTVLGAFQPELDVPAWTKAVRWAWDEDARVTACDQLLRGFSFDPENSETHRLATRQPRWAQVGRALRAATSAQRAAFEGNVANLQIAHEVGYSDGSSMNRAVRRAFGVPTSMIRGTVGWEWLMWWSLTGRRITSGGVADRRP